MKDLVIAKKLHTLTVGKWRQRFAGKRVEGILDEPRPGQPRTIQDNDVERVVVKTLQTKQLRRGVFKKHSAVGEYDQPISNHSVGLLIQMQS